MGLLESSDWTARWISGDYKPNKKERYSVDCFRKKFSIKKSVSRSAEKQESGVGTSAESVVKARIYASVRGVYDMTLNGKRIEDFILAPGMTDYRKRI